MSGETQQKIQGFLSAIDTLSNGQVEILTGMPKKTLGGQMGSFVHHSIGRFSQLSLELNKVMRKPSRKEWITVRSIAKRCIGDMGNDLASHLVDLNATLPDLHIEEAELCMLAVKFMRSPEDMPELRAKIKELDAICALAINSGQMLNDIADFANEEIAKLPEVAQTR